jgi:3-methyladenine DNA glycosylase AlkC
MAEAFKNLINPQTVQAVAHHLHRVWPAFPRSRFEQLAGQGLDELEFKARAVHLSHALQACLPDDFLHAADLLQASLKAVPTPVFDHDPDDDLGSLSTDDSGLGGWALWAFGDYTARCGLNQPERALALLHALTQRFTAEFAIRPFIVAHPERVYATLAQWQHDPSAHVRRLVSEGSRPRLPWGLRLQQLVQDPSPTLPWLRQLQDDPSAYVRRSVANHLNDIAKDHPDLVASWLDAHLPGATLQRQRLLRHASRTLIKAGHPGTLNAWGLGQAFAGQATLSAHPPQLRIGEAVQLRVALRSQAASAQTLEMDLRVHHIKAKGHSSPKTFKGKRLQLAPGEQLQWERQHSFAPVSTRRYHPGPHRIELLLNGKTVAEATVLLQD